MFFLPARMGGLGIRDPVELCNLDFSVSQAGSAIVSDAVKGSITFDWSEHLARLQTASASYHQQIEAWHIERLHHVLGQFPEACQHAIK